MITSLWFQFLMKSEIQIRGISLGCKHMNSDADQQLRTSELLDRVDCGRSGVPVPERRKPLGTLSLNLIQSLSRNRLGRNQVQDWVRMACVSHSITVWHNSPRMQAACYICLRWDSSGCAVQRSKFEGEKLWKEFCNEVRKCEKQGKKISMLWKCDTSWASGNEVWYTLLLEENLAISNKSIYSCL